ncbi:MAG: glycerophosphodiester phosphodiesterase [Haloarculaceae archaeon]
MRCIAHRGFAGDFPENTVAAVRQAAGTADLIEVDVRRCGSGELVAIHDSTVDRVTGAAGRVVDFTAEELGELDVLGSGVGVPTLRAVFEAIPDSVGVVLDLKVPDVAADALAVAEAAGNDVLVSSFDGQILDEVAATDSRTPPLALVFDEAPDDALERARRHECVAVHPHWQLCSREFVRTAHDLSFSVHGWPVDSRDAVRELRRAEADGLIADRRRFCPS